MDIGGFVEAHFTSKNYMRDRFAEMITDAWRILKEAEATHADGHEIVARVSLFSGGNDSTVLTHLVRHYATHAAHANTTVGIERTRQYVRDTSAAWGLPLLEREAPVSFSDLVKERGFPGPAMHFKMYQRLKERPLHQIRRELVKNPSKQRVMFIAGRRRLESARRSSVPEHERVGSIIWASPLANWSSDDMRIYRALNPDIPRNPISDALGMSGECLCGAFAEPGELERVRAIDPECADWIDRLEAEVLEAGITDHRCKWGWGATFLDNRISAAKSGPLCSCHDPLFTLTKDDIK